MPSSQNGSPNSGELQRLSRELIWPNWSAQQDMERGIQEDAIRKYLDIPRGGGIHNAGNTTNVVHPPTGGGWKSALVAGAMTLGGIGLGGFGAAYAIKSLAKPAETIVKERIVPGDSKTVEKNYGIGQPKVE